MSRESEGLVRSVKVRLTRHAKEIGVVVVAEKMHAMTILGSKNSRMRGFQAGSTCW